MESNYVKTFEDFYSPEGEAQTFTLKDLRAAFEGGHELVWEDLEQTQKTNKYTDFFEWYKEYQGEK